ncbi:hypothetical protein FQA39_LY15652 [Lamprigera yunnana]|nr:hypothetical protein FQA39_LY15652 [Lamprigera yunnana]
MNQSMEKIQKLFNTMQEKIDEKWEKKYVDLDCKMVERKVQVDNNSGHIDGNCKGLRELIDVEAKINQDTEEKIQICKALKEQSKDIRVAVALNVNIATVSRISQSLKKHEVVQPVARSLVHTKPITNVENFC